MYEGDSFSKLLFTTSPTMQIVTTSPDLAGKGGFLEKMNVQPAATFKRGIKFEGLRFAMGDFLFSCAQASSLGGSKHFIGVVAEVEYLPMSSMAASKPIMEVNPVPMAFYLQSDSSAHICRQDWICLMSSMKMVLYSLFTSQSCRG